jgi:phage terminase large subunit-like protein
MFDNEAAMAATEFIEYLRHSDGKWAGVPFKLLPWQRNIITDVYGTLRENGLRQHEFVYLEVPKKNGKTELAAAAALYHLFADNEENAEVYGCAAERQQAHIAFDAAVNMVDQCPALKKITKFIPSQSILKNTKNKGIYKVLSAEAYSKHGYKPSAVIFDELHAQPDRRLWDIMTFGAGDIRAQPIWWVITTAGDDPDRTSIGWEIHEKARRIIEGEIIDPRWYCKIYGAPDDCDIWHEENWYKANPSLGTIIDIDKVRQAAQSARENPAEEKLFRWLRLNQWVALKSISWLPLTLWDSTDGKWDMAELVGKKCYAGLDLSSTTDITGLTILFPPQEGIEEWRAIFEAWIPEEGMKRRVIQDHVPYDKWVNQKFLHATPGNAVDYEFVEATINQLALKYDLQILGTDPWNSRMLTQRLMKNDINVQEVPQTMAGLSPAMKHIEKLLLTERLTHEKNPVARWCFGNVMIAIDGNENIKPMKNKSIERIDVTVSLINAMAIAMQYEMESIYESRGLVVL